MRFYRLILAAMVLLTVGGAARGANSWTGVLSGNANADFLDNSAGQLPLPGVQTFPTDIARLTPMMEGWFSGSQPCTAWATCFYIKAMHFYYNSALDKLYVGFGLSHDPRPGDLLIPVAWDTDGNGNYWTSSKPTGLSPIDCRQSAIPKFGYSNVNQIAGASMDQGEETYKLTFTYGLVSRTINLAQKFNGANDANFILENVNGFGPLEDEWWNPKADPNKKIYDIEYSITKFLETLTGIKSKPIAMNSRVAVGVAGSSDKDGPAEFYTDLSLTFPSIGILKEVACSPQGPWLPATQALPGSNVYFRVAVTNTGSENLVSVQVKDTFEGVETIYPIGNLAIGETKYVEFSPGVNYLAYTIPQNFSVVGKQEDIINTAVATGVYAPVPMVIPVVSPESKATVDVLVPGMTVDKGVRVTGSTGLFVKQLDLRNTDKVADNEPVTYRLTVTNTGEVPIDFTQGECLKGGFFDNKLSVSTDGVSPTPIDPDLATRFFAKLGSELLPPGQSVFVDVDVTIDETKFCDTSRLDNTFTACGLATQAGICLPPAGGVELTQSSSAAVLLEYCVPKLVIDKQISCDKASGFAYTKAALRGSKVYYRVTVSNTGLRDMTNVVVTDTLTDLDGALDLTSRKCWEETTGGDVVVPNFVGGTINVGNLAQGQTRTYKCEVTIKPGFAINGKNPDVTNTITAIGKADIGGTSTEIKSEYLAPANTSAKLDVLVPGISVEKGVKITGSNGDFLKLLDVRDGTVDNELVTYRLTVTNTGELPIDFSKGTCAHNFYDSIISVSTPGVIVTPQDVAKLFTDKIPGTILAPGASVFVEIPLTLKEAELCNRQSITNTFTACGFATQAGICLPASGGETVTGNSSATVQLEPCMPKPIIDKQISCDKTSGFAYTKEALRGSKIYYKVTVSNAAGLRDMTNVVVTDTLTDLDGALDLTTEKCWEETGGGDVPVPNFVPGTINVGNLAQGQTRTYKCEVTIKPGFAIPGKNPDVINSITAVGKTDVFGTPKDLTFAYLDPANTSAKLNVLVPGMTVDKGVKITGSGGDFVKVLDVKDGTVDNEPVTYRLTVTNTGELPIDFTKGSCTHSFYDDIISVKTPGVVVTPQDVAAKFIQKMGGALLPPGQTVFVDLDVTIDEKQFCDTSLLKNTFTACGLATKTGICLPASGGETVTGNSSATVQLEPCMPKPIIDKQISCDKDTGFAYTKAALRGSKVYYKVTVSNAAGLRDMTNVVVTDTLTDLDSALDLSTEKCWEVTIGNPVVPNFLGDKIIVGNLAKGQIRVYMCEVTIKPGFAVKSKNPDVTNSITAVGKTDVFGTVKDLVFAYLDPANTSAKLDVLVPGMTVDKRVKNNEIIPEVWKTSPETLDLSDGTSDIENVTYRLTVENTGDVALRFDPTVTCTDPFADSLLEKAIPGINDGKKTNINALFAAKLTGGVIPAGQKVVVDIPAKLEELVLCDTDDLWDNTFSVCASTVSPAGACRPASGEENLDGNSSASVKIYCPITIHIEKAVKCGQATPVFADYGAGPKTIVAGNVVSYLLTVENTGKYPLDPVEIKDTLVDTNGAASVSGAKWYEIVGGALQPVGPILNVVFNLPDRPGKPDLAMGETRRFVIELPTVGQPSVMRATFTNSAHASGTFETTVTDDQSLEVSVDACKASLVVDKTVASVEKPDVWSKTLDLNDGAMDDEGVIYKIKITNNGELDIDFTKGDCSKHFSDSLLETANAGIIPTPVDVAKLVESKLPAGLLKKGASVEI
ncbi:MAG: hypothetical protein WCL39_03925, partial [Armatimonadota bacterium]